MDRASEIRAAVQKAISRVLENTDRQSRAFKDEDQLSAQIGLDSLDLAQVVVMLEQELGIDPFRTAGAPVRTLGDLIRRYSSALEKSS